LAANGLQRLPPVQRRQDSVQDTFDVAVDFVVVKAGHTVAAIEQDLFSRTIATALLVGRMSRAIDLDDKLLLSANEVGEIGPDGLLPNEFEPGESAVPKSPPELAFSLGLVLAQLASSARFVQA
jgi:hypothetical protein